MANKVVLDFEVGGVGQVDSAIKTVGDYRKAVKAAKDEQLAAAAAYGTSSEQFVKATKRLSDLKDKVEDLSDSTQSLKGSGIERASQGFSQFGEGLRNLDFDKVKVGLTAIKSALAATGIMLVVQGVSYLIENFDELSKGSGIVAQALQAVGGYLTDLKNVIYSVTDALGLTNSALDKQGEAIKTNADKAKEALEGQTAEYDRQIAIAKASGKSAVDLEIAKQEAIVRTNKAIADQIIAYQRSGGVLNEEQMKLFNSSIDAIKNAKNQEQLIRLADNEKQKADHKKHLEDLDKQGEENYKSYQAKMKAQKDADNQQAFDDEYGEFLAQQDRLKQAKIDAEIAETERLRQVNEANDYYRQENQKTQDQAALDQTKATEEKKRAEQQETINQYTQATQQGLAAAQQITDLYFSYRLNKVKGDQKAENDIKKKQFQVNKAFGITNAVIDGIGAVQKALNNPYPLNIVLAAISGIAAAANIAKIASTKFEPSTGGGGGGEAPASIPIPAPPTISTPKNDVSGTSFDENGKKVEQGEKGAPMINVKANIGVDEVSDKQKRVETLEKQSTF